MKFGFNVLLVLAVLIFMGITDSADNSDPMIMDIFYHQYVPNSTTGESESESKCPIERKTLIACTESAFQIKVEDTDEDKTIWLDIQWGDGEITSTNTRSRSASRYYKCLKHKYAAHGNYNVTVMAKDSKGATNTTTEKVTVDAIAQNPILIDDTFLEIISPYVSTNLSSVAPGLDTTFEFHLPVLEEVNASNPMNYSISWEPDSGKWDISGTSSSNVFYGTKKYEKANTTYGIGIAAKHNSCSSKVKRFTIKTNNNSNAPEITNIEPREVNVDKDIAFNITATDKDGNSLVYSIDWLNDGDFNDVNTASVMDDAGIECGDVKDSLSNVQSCRFTKNGTKIIRVRVYDGQRHSEGKIFNLSVICASCILNEAPSITYVGPGGTKKAGVAEFNITVKDKKRGDATSPTHDELNCTYLCNWKNNENLPPYSSACVKTAENWDSETKKEYWVTNYTAACRYTPGTYTLAVYVKEAGSEKYDEEKLAGIKSNAMPTVDCPSPRVLGKKQFNNTGINFTINANDPDGDAGNLRYYLDCYIADNLENWDYTNVTDGTVFHCPSQSFSYGVRVRACDAWDCSVNARGGVEDSCLITLHPNGSCSDVGRCCNKCKTGGEIIEYKDDCENDPAGSVCCRQGQCDGLCSPTGTCLSEKPKYCNKYGYIENRCGGTCNCTNPVTDVCNLDGTCTTAPSCTYPTCSGKNTNTCMCGNIKAPEDTWCCAPKNNYSFSDTDCKNAGPVQCQQAQAPCSSCCTPPMNCLAAPISGFCASGECCPSGKCVQCVASLPDCGTPCQCKGGCTCPTTGRYGDGCQVSGTVPLSSTCGGDCKKNLARFETCNCLTGCTCPNNSENAGPVAFNVICRFKTVNATECKAACISPTGRNCGTDQSCIDQCEAECNVASTISYVIKILYAIAAGIAALMITFHGFRWLTADSPEARADAKRGIAFVILGLIVIAIALTLIEVLYETICNRVFPGSCGGLI